MNTGAADPPGTEFRGEIAILLQEVTGEDAEWLAQIGPTTRLDGDLLMDSVELAALSQTLQGRYGDQVNLLAWVSDLDIDQIIALNVADVADYVAAQTKSVGTEVGGR